MSDRVTLTDHEARRLLNAIVKEFVQMTAEELEQQEGNRYRSPLSHTFRQPTRKQSGRNLQPF